MSTREPTVRHRSQRQSFAALAAIAVGMTLLNCTKPLTVDDPFFCAYAKQITRDPLHPGDFTLYGRHWPTPAVSMLPPPVLPYWLALSMSRFPDSPAIWKLSLLPFSLLLAFGLYFVARRCVGGLAMPIVVMVLLSPAFLPAQNLMLELPVMALTVSGVAVQLRAVRKKSVTWAAVAGILGGLACQTKYTGLIAPVLFAAAGFLYGSALCGTVAALIAAAIFVGWEAAAAAAFGHSPFLFSAQYHFLGKNTRLVLLESLLCSWALLSPAHLGWRAIGPRWRLGLALGLAGLAGMELGLGLPLSQGFWILLAVGLLIAWYVAAAARNMVLRRRPRRSDWLLLFWLAAEFASFLLVTPFPAARRLVGILIAGSLVLGRSGALSPVPKRRVRSVLWGLAGVNAVAGLAVFGIDWLESAAGRTAAVQSAAAIRNEDANAVIWCEGHWGFEFYAERLGMRPIDADHTVLRAGEWLVIPQSTVPTDVAEDDPSALTSFQPIEVDDLIPWSTLGYYGGFPPISYRHAPRQSVLISRAVKDTRLVTTWNIADLPGWIRDMRGSVFAAQSLTFLLSKLNSPDDESRVQAALALEQLGPEAVTAEPRLRERLGDSDPRVRKICCDALAALTHCQPESIEQLRSATHDPDPQVRAAAERALARL